MLSHQAVPDGHHFRVPVPEGVHRNFLCRYHLALVIQNCP